MRWPLSAPCSRSSYSCEELHSERWAFSQYDTLFSSWRLESRCYSNVLMTNRWLVRVVELHSKEQSLEKKSTLKSISWTLIEKVISEEPVPPFHRSFNLAILSMYMLTFFYSSLCLFLVVAGQKNSTPECEQSFDRANSSNLNSVFNTNSYQNQRKNWSIWITRQSTYPVYIKLILASKVFWKQMMEFLKHYCFEQCMERYNCFFLSYVCLC